MKFALILSFSLFLAAPVLAEVHEVEMFNRNETGPMIYAPQFLRIAPGDSVRFIPTQSSHNAATIEGMIPAGAEPFRSAINEDFTVTFTEPGSYGIKCSPHFDMGMVMLIHVGDGIETTLPADLPPRARERFEAILATIE